MVSVCELEEVDEKVKEISDLTWGMGLVAQENGCGEDGIFNIEKQLRDLSKQINELMEKARAQEEQNSTGAPFTVLK